MGTLFFRCKINCTLIHFSLPFRQYQPIRIIIRHVLPVRWLFTKKMNALGQVERYKARFVVKGFKQRPGIEYNDVYAPVTSKTTLRVLLAIFVTKKMFVRQLDIKTAFLLGTLDEDINLFCEQPPGFSTQGPGGERLVCRLVKSLYGLKQAPKCWADTLAKVLVKHGFLPCHFDTALFVKRHEHGEWSYVDTYVDDFLVGVKEIAVYDALVAAMRTAGWEVKELSLPSQFLSLDMAWWRGFHNLFLPGKPRP
jgi:Reverse transcriptase (RNA-dependent DNA polymerase)